MMVVKNSFHKKAFFQEENSWKTQSYQAIMRDKSFKARNVPSINFRQASHVIIIFLWCHNAFYVALWKHTFVDNLYFIGCAPS